MPDEPPKGLLGDQPPPGGLLGPNPQPPVQPGGLLGSEVPPGSEAIIGRAMAGARPEGPWDTLSRWQHSLGPIEREAVADALDALVQAQSATTQAGREILESARQSLAPHQYQRADRLLTVSDEKLQVVARAAALIRASRRG